MQPELASHSTSLAHKLKFVCRPQFTGDFDSLNGDDTALLSDITFRAQGLRQAVNDDEKHTLSPEAIVRYH